MTASDRMIGEFSIGTRGHHCPDIKSGSARAGATAARSQQIHTRHNRTSDLAFQSLNERA